MSIDRETVRNIEAAINELANEFKQTPGLLLTEDDLKCHLVAKLYGMGTLNDPVESADSGVRATAVHAEVPWFDEADHLRLRPDITITDPSRLSIQRSMQKGIPFPRKGCHLTGNSVVVELKFYRKRVQPTALSEIRKDIAKIALLVERGTTWETFIHGLVVVFTRYADMCHKIKHLEKRKDGKVTVIVRSVGLRRRKANRRSAAARSHSRR